MNIVHNTQKALAFGAALLYTSVSQAFAQGVGSPFIRAEDCIPGLTCAGDFRSAVIGYLNYFLAFLGLVAVVMIIYAGVLMVTAAGNEDSVNKGKTIIMYASIGIVIVLLAWTIVNFVIGVGQAV